MKQKTLGQITHEAMLRGAGWVGIARAVVREHEKRKGVCVCSPMTCIMKDVWKYCPKCGKRIKVGGK